MLGGDHLVIFMVVLVLGNPPANAGHLKRHGFDTWVRRIPWRSAWQPSLVFLPARVPWTESMDRVPWTEKPNGLRSVGSQRIRHN